MHPRTILWVALRGLLHGPGPSHNNLQPETKSAIAAGVGELTTCATIEFSALDICGLSSSPISTESRLLKALEGLLDQCRQMHGLFLDSDGQIAEAISAAEEALALSDASSGRYGHET